MDARMSDLAYRISRFIVVGGTATAIHLGILFTLTEYGGLWYVYSTVIAFLVALVFNFTAQKYWVFKHADHGSITHQLPLHALTNVVNLGLNTGLLFVLVEYVHLWYLAAQVFTSVFIAAESYIVYRWIFR